MNSFFSLPLELMAECFCYWLLLPKVNDTKKIWVHVKTKQFSSKLSIEKTTIIHNNMIVIWFKCRLRKRERKKKKKSPTWMLLQLSKSIRTINVNEKWFHKHNKWIALGSNHARRVIHSSGTDSFFSFHSLPNYVYCHFELSDSTLIVCMWMWKLQLGIQTEKSTPLNSIKTIIWQCLFINSIRECLSTSYSL